MHWSILLAIAICSEIFGTSMLKLSLGFGVAFYCLSLALKHIPLGMAYAIWSGVGLVLTAMIGVIVFNEKIDMWGVFGIGLIVAGVVVLNVLSKMGGH